jgi:Mce-associated membrane protein
VANDADAVERALNASTRVLSPGAKGSDARPSDNTRGATTVSDESPADHEARTASAIKVSDDDQTEDQVDAQDDGQDKAAGATHDGDGERSAGAPNATPGIRFALVVGLVTILTLGGMAGWFGYAAFKNHQTEQMRNLFLAVGRQGAVNLTTINYTEADAAIQRILDSSTGQFYDDFSKRSAAFVDVVKQTQAKTDGSIVEAGLESVDGDSARVLVAVLVTTSTKGATDQQPRHWRMRIDVQKVSGTVKVANVGFVP